MATTLNQTVLKALAARLKSANGMVANYYQGESSERTPVHTLYGGAQLFKRTTAQKIGQLASRHFEAHCSQPAQLVEVFGIQDPGMATAIIQRTQEKLSREAVEDFRIDFEDGFGVRPEAEEDETAIFAAKELAAAWQEGVMSPFSGIRIKSLGEETKLRSLRTLDIFLTQLVESTGRNIPDGFVVTLPKITCLSQVEVFVEALQALEVALGLPQQTLKFEIMVETAQSIIAEDGRALIPDMIRAGQGRCTGAHFGTYDYTAGMNITANYQAMDHPSCDFAREMMKVTLAGTGVQISDGATNIMPVALYKEPQDAAEEKANKEAIQAAMRLSYDHIRHSLKQGIYQGWDLHPGQIPVRYIALYAFFLEGLEPAQTRLRNFMDHAAKATLAGDVFDDAATGQGLLNYFLRALGCGAITKDQVTTTGLTEAEIATRSFLQIIKGRQG